MARIQLYLEYEGTNYVGWQKQASGLSIQTCVQTALRELLGAPVLLWVAGRTDAGVHARRQVAVFDTTRELPLRAFMKGVNARLPRDIAVVEACIVADDFHPRHMSKSKHYAYYISNRPCRSPLRRLTHWQIFKPLNVEAMQEGAAFLLGSHDFSSFRASDCTARHAVRRLDVSCIEGESGGEIICTFKGTAFLKHMVRSMVGSLVEVGKGRRPPEWIAQALVQRNRCAAGPTAPPHGLVLEGIVFGEREHTREP
ncbi:MAG: tRNA pseudouridine(38-40) synthase TruA [Proteobacteria bacterium]|nr:tRNA pseudouridine(38-40) synthase TruA [Cystobacterineae bacterium]MCL2258540.1 tRNA pseudouridine(38-40) synthase TruA [Cystobacterineae bacterium]MCL2315123.1 tRNA pseudouridine(38-40) synthase TruA [Pseudomonadota bacterium]